MVHVIRSVDAHAGGAAVRLLVEGVPSPTGKTMAQKRDWMSRHGDHLRRSVVLEPRGHAGMSAAMLTEPVTPGAHAGLLFMDADGYPALSGGAVMAAATIAVERRLIESADPSRLTFDTAAGTVHAAVQLRLEGEQRHGDAVTITNVPSYVVLGGHRLRLGSRELRVDIAFGGARYAIVDTEAIGIAISATTLPELHRLAVQVREAAAAHDVTGVIFTGPPNNPAAHLRSVVVTGGRVDRSASVTGTSAVMAVLDAMGLLDETQPFVHESLIGTLLHGRIARRTQVGEQPAIVPAIDGSAWITGEQTMLIDDEDPLHEGFRT
jgi:proline racemase